MIQTVNVRVLANDPSGIPLANAVVTAKLNRPDVDATYGYVAPDPVVVTADDNGVATLALWPNELGSAASSYNVKIEDPNSGTVQRITATIPNADCDLHLVANLPPYPGKPDGQLIIDAAVAAVAPAQAAASAAAGSATSAATSASDAASDATSAAGSAASAQGAADDASANQASAAASASAASAAAGQAAASAGQASDHAGVAAASAATASEQAGIATAAVATASGHKDSAAISAGQAASSATSANTSALGAANSASSANQSAATATTQAAQASQSASDAAASAAIASERSGSTAASVSTAAAAANQAIASASVANTSQQQAAIAASGAANSESSASASAALARQWATQTDTEVVRGSGFGAKFYAQEAISYSLAAADSAGTATAAANTATSQALAGVANYNNVLAINGQAATSATQAANSYLQATVARDAAIAASQVAAAPTEQLAAFAQSIHSGNVVASFLYDVSRDSDGGGWIKRCQHTSWYTEAICTGAWRGQLANLTAAWNVTGAAVGDFYQNTTDGKFYTIGGTKVAPTQTEVFRGNRREFPALTGVVAEAGRVVIYDLMQPGCPMWMVFVAGANNAIGTGAALTSVSTVGGKILVGSGGGGLHVLDFVCDFAYLHGSSIATTTAMVGGLSLRNSASGRIAYGGATSIVDLTVNAIAATVLPGAPVDPATNLPVPTIAVATAGGVSVIKHDGTVVNSASTTKATSVAIDAKTLAWTNSNGQAPWATAPGALTAAFSNNGYTSATIPALWGFASKIVIKGDKIVGSNLGLTLGKDNPATPAKGMVTYITNAYNTGWQVGDVRGCWLADTVAETIAASGELVSNGMFDTDTSGWAPNFAQPLTIVGGKLRVTSDGSVSQARAGWTFATVPGKTYSVTVDAFAGTAPASVSVNRSGSISLGIAGDPSEIVSVGNSKTVMLNFVATGATATLLLSTNSTAGQYADFDNISVKVAAPDRSVKNKGMVVYGSFAKTPVATGAQLVGFAIASAGSYMEQPYNSDLDYGTGTFAFYLEMKEGANSAAEVIFERAYYTAGAYSGARIRCEVDATGKLKATYSDGTNTVTQTSTNAINSATWQAGVIVGYDGTNFRMLQNGADIATPVARGAVGSLSNANAVFRAYLDVSGANGATNATLALLRHGATFPTTDQSGTIYRDELAMFQPGAQVTIDGTSSAVTALSYDDTTELLQVGTSWGRTAMHGLLRVESAATQVGSVTAISAGIGSHITAGASGARYVQPAMVLRDELRRKGEAKRAAGKEILTVDTDFIAGQTTYTLPYGYTTKNVWVAGAPKRIGATKDYTTSFDGYRETVTFAVSPGAAWVRIDMNRSA